MMMSSEAIETIAKAAQIIIGLATIVYVSLQYVTTSQTVENFVKSTRQLDEQRGHSLELLSNAEKELEQNKETFLNSYRPRIVVFAQNPSSMGNQDIFFTVKNVGSLPAKNITLRFDPTLKNAQKHYNLGHLQHLLCDIPILPSGGEVGHIFDNILPIRKSSEDLPEEYVVDLEYFSINEDRTFHESYVVNMRPFLIRQSNWFSLESI